LKLNELQQGKWEVAARFVFADQKPGEVEIPTENLSNGRAMSPLSAQEKYTGAQSFMQMVAAS
jgi:hypothetical protein